MTPWQKIMRAAQRGTGLRLSAEEVSRMSSDGAIATLAENDDEDDIERGRETMKCPTCKGSGEVYSAKRGKKTCPTCRGKGYVKKGKGKR